MDELKIVTQKCIKNFPKDREKTEDVARGSWRGGMKGALEDSSPKEVKHIWMKKTNHNPT